MPRDTALHPPQGSTPLWGDPRPDLRVDSPAWSRFLTMARARHGEWFASCLAYFRAHGLRIMARGDKLKLVCEPGLNTEAFCHGPLDEPPAWREFHARLQRRQAGSPALGWATEQEYAAERDEFLRPYSRDILALLADLAGTYEGSTILA